jgi:hypothetical protein
MITDVFFDQNRYIRKKVMFLLWNVIMRQFFLISTFLKIRFTSQRMKFYFIRLMFPSFLVKIPEQTATGTGKC